MLFRSVPYGGIEPYYGTNPISFAAPTADERTVVFDMATTVQAWGKILDKRSRHESIPDTWAVDAKGRPVTDSRLVNALVPIEGAKGYGLMMMVDYFSGVLHKPFYISLADEEAVQCLNLDPALFEVEEQDRKSVV